MNASLIIGLMLLAAARFPSRKPIRLPNRQFSLSPEFYPQW